MENYWEVSFGKYRWIIFSKDRPKIKKYKNNNNPKIKRKSLLVADELGKIDYKRLKKHINQ